MDKKIRISSAAVLSSIIVIVFITAITIIADLNPALKDWLKNTFSHHWIGKGILSVVIFAVLTFLFSILPAKDSDAGLAKKLSGLFWISVLGTLAIFGFYFYEALLAV
ncbi:MAG TPA: hypothetical protein VJB92_03050 [Candidatus Paceibacterota bacterium]